MLEDVPGSPKKSDCYIAGIGASAGGLEAISQLISHLEPDMPCGYVVLQHLSPSHKSMMVEILARETTLEVCEATDGCQIKAGTIYIVPANSNATLKDGCVVLTPADPAIAPKPSINQFLISLAAEEGERAIGIILSGTGTDGTAGLRSIQAAGGYAIVQSPETAKYDGMPCSAIESGMGDHVLPPEDIASHLKELLNQSELSEDALDSDTFFVKLLGKLQDRLKFDFTGYKPGTLNRRIRRRIVATHNKNLATYCDWVDSHPSELDALARDLLISVTAFFRDKRAFEALVQVVEQIIRTKKPGDEIRVWVAGCASGEEAYSIAMLFADILRDKFHLYKIQIFSTDVDEEALNIARRGIYPAAALAELPRGYLENYFNPIPLGQNSYEIKPNIRDMLVFARHNLVSDPPFFRLDLIACRNVLIYFDAGLQSKVLHTFHFGLSENGYLFLGRSESVSHSDSLFQAVNTRERLYLKTGQSSSTSISRMPRIVPRKPKRDEREQQMLGALIEHFGVAAALCDAEGNILHTAGQIDLYLKVPEGKPGLNIYNLVVPVLNVEMVTLLHKCKKSRAPQKGRSIYLENETWVRVCVNPVKMQVEQLFLVYFVHDKDVLKGGEIAEATLQALPEDVTQWLIEKKTTEDELAATREHLQTLMEEMATANEEMQALNEEAQASNEELQAANEELETANEEMQATNEELISLNDELSSKTLALSELTVEYAQLYDALLFPVLVFDCDLHLLRYNKAAENQLNLRKIFLSLHISGLGNSAVFERIEPLLQRVLTTADRDEVTIEYQGKALRIAVSAGLDDVNNVTSLIVTLVDISELTGALAKLASSQSQLSAVMEYTSVLFAIKNMDGLYIYANAKFLDWFGLDRFSYQGKKDSELFDRHVAKAFWAQSNQLLHSIENSSIVTEMPVNRSGKQCYLNVTLKIFDDQNKNPSGFIFQAEDITEIKKAQEQLRIFNRVYEHAGEAIFITDKEKVVQEVNDAFSRITGYSRADVVGKDISLFGSDNNESEHHKLIWKTINTAGTWQGELFQKTKSGSVFPSWTTFNCIKDEQGNVEHYVGIMSDITPIKQSLEKAEYLATHDVLTGLPNRSMFFDHLQKALAYAKRKNTRVCLIFIDLDNFKTINDTLGHHVGDGLLEAASSRLVESSREIDTVARLGGDEFAIILVDADEMVADQVSRRVGTDLSRGFIIDHKELFVSASIGVAFYPDDSADMSGLVEAADAAMYRAKDEGRNCVEFFKADLRISMLQRAAIENALRETLRRDDRLRLVFQPKYSLQAGESIIGAEALLRWTDPILGEIGPAQFIPVAESSGLILQLDKKVLEMAVGYLQEWSSHASMSSLVMAVNLSSRSVRNKKFINDFVEKFGEAISLLGSLQIEITEGALLDNTNETAENINRLHQVGIKLAIDDFGTGYSSLAYLKRLPLTELKLDKSFVDGLGNNPEDEAIARAILGLAHELSLITVAEGIETERQKEWLVKNNCRCGQGFLLARPESVIDFAKRFSPS